MLEIQEFFFDTLDSTQTYAKNNKGSFDTGKLTCISAANQTQGVGRFCNRKWISPKGKNISATFYCRIKKTQKEIAAIGQVLCVTISTILINEGLSPSIKWPNDILLNQCKVSGLLCETTPSNDGYINLFLGLGINVNSEKADFKDTSFPATTLKNETNKSWDLKDLLHKLQKQLCIDLDIFINKGFSAFAKQFDNLLAYKGDVITCEVNRHVITGTLKTINEDGALVLQLPNNEEKLIYAGEIFLLRKA
jgi:BirA family transcriptional regulator, biotin operon repressor / biotin---[acetyl-CoA-carboxylase] ligase